jgi:hypothetical protein
MTLLASDAVAHIRHTLASVDVPSIGAYRILNDAGEYLCNMHHWTWLEGAQQTLPLTKDQDYVWLPDDFREIMALQLENGLSAGIRMTTQAHLLELRALATAPSFEYHAAVVYAPRGAAASTTLVVGALVNGTSMTISDAYNPSVTINFKTTVAATDDDDATTRYMQIGATAADSATTLAKVINDAPGLFLRATVNNATVTLTHQKEGERGNSQTVTVPAAITATQHDTGVNLGPVRARLEMWPTPSVSDDNRIMVYYRRGWQALESDNQLVAVPQWCESLYLQLVRAIARGYERESEADVDTRLMSIRQGASFKAAAERDKTDTAHIGSMRNGAAMTVRRGYDHLYNFNSTAGPS